MKLLYIMNKIDGRGGLNRIAFDKINYLINMYEIEVIYFGKGNSKPFYYVDDRIVFHNIEIDAFSSFRKKVENLFKVYFDYVHLLRRIKPDVIVNMNTNILSWIIPFVNFKIPKLIELHQSFDGVRIFNEKAFGKNSLKSKFSMFLRYSIYPKYDKIIVLTHTDKRKWGFKNIEVIPNFTNMPIENKGIVKSHNFLWVGRLSHQKGIDLLIKIWDTFLKVDSDWHLVIIGNSIDINGPKEKLLEYLKKTVGKNRITYVEETKEMPKFYRESSIYLSTSRYEGLPLCLIEAATMGKPIIGFDITGNDEVVDNGKNGILVPPYDIASYVSAMNELSFSETKRHIYSCKSLEKSKDFNKEIIMKKWVNLFDDIIKNKR